MKNQWGRKNMWSYSMSLVLLMYAYLRVEQPGAGKKPDLDHAGGQQRADQHYNRRNRTGMRAEGNCFR